MSTKTKWILACNTVLIFSMFGHIICARNASSLIGVVRNLTVEAIEDKQHLANNNIHRSLKLNVSWSPPVGRQPNSYSVIVTSLPKKDDTSTTECTEESLYYTSPNSSQFNVLLPQYRINLDMPEMHIRPRCSYKIEVHANPRLKPTLRSPEVIYTVPECIGDSCSCVGAEAKLPRPNVYASKHKDHFLISWDVSVNNSNVNTYEISVGVPLLVSKAGVEVYNYSKITTTTADTTSFLWNQRLGKDQIDFAINYKILVIAVDRRGCHGAEGSFLIRSAPKSSPMQATITWAPFLGISVCILLAVLSFVTRHARKKYHLICREQSNRMRKRMGISKCHSQLAESVLRHRNILYVEQERGSTMYKNILDEGQVPYKSVTLKHELGRGQFGKVYLGSLDNQKEPLVAVKMSHCSDPNDILEARRHFLEEIDMMKAAGPHPHLVTLIGYCTLPDKPICIILEYMEMGDLLTYLHSRRKKRNKDFSVDSSSNTRRASISKTLNIMPSCQHSSAGYGQLFKHSTKYSGDSGVNLNADRRRLRYMNIREAIQNEQSNNLCDKIDTDLFLSFSLDIAQGMEHLEAKGITHRDLAARNVLVSSDLTLKVSDFGLSRNGIYVMNAMPGTVRHLPIRWMSPEALRDRAFSSKSDVWSFGIVLWEIGTLGAFPYPGVADDQLLRHIIYAQGHLERPDGVSYDMYNIMSDCWAFQPEERPSFKQLVVDLQVLKKSVHLMTVATNPCYTILPSIDLV